MRTDTRELLAIGILGGRSRLGDRIEVLLRRGRTFSPHVSTTGITASAIVLGALLLAGALAPRWIAFAQQQPAPAFEVASIKTNKGAEGRSVLRVNPEGISSTSVTLMQCIAEAYQVRYSQISGHELPAERYDIEARVAGAITKEQSRLMLQMLLADRFKLRLHHEARVVPVYKLVAGKNGPNLHESPGEGEGSILQRPDGLEFRHMSMYLFSAILTGRLGRPVLDQTGMNGSFDFTLRLDLETPPGPESKAVASDWSSSSIFTDMQKQLGLKLDADKAPVDYLVIDHAEKPDAN